MPKSNRTKKSGGRFGGLLFGCIFFGAGFFSLWMMSINPILKSVGSNDWTQTNCVILSSEIDSHSSSNGTTYSIEIGFQYTIDGRTFTSDTYSFDSMNSSGYDGKAKVVAQYPVGSEHLCWVNPDDPNQAVIYRDIPKIVFFTIPLCSIFVLIGMGAILSSLGVLPKKWSVPFNKVRHKPVSTEAKGTRRLKPKTSGIAKVLIITAVAVFWNGIVSVFLAQIIKGFQRDEPEWFLTIFMIPFVCIGLLLIYGIFHTLLALANPKLALTLSESSPKLGQSLELEWQANKPLHRVSKLQIFLIGRETATYRRGTSTVTDTSTFYQEVALSIDAPHTQQRGIIKLQLPRESMHSFDSGNNKILWEFVVDGTINWYPDIEDIYPITMRPLIDKNA